MLFETIYFIDKVQKELRSEISGLIKIISTIRICFSEMSIGLIKIGLYILLNVMLTLFHAMKNLLILPIIPESL